MLTSDNIVEFLPCSRNCNLLAKAPGSDTLRFLISSEEFVLLTSSLDFFFTRELSTLPLISNDLVKDPTLKSTEERWH